MQIYVLKNMIKEIKFLFHFLNITRIPYFEYFIYFMSILFIKHLLFRKTWIYLFKINFMSFLKINNKFLFLLLKKLLNKKVNILLLMYLFFYKNDKFFYEIFLYSRYINNLFINCK